MGSDAAHRRRPADLGGGCVFILKKGKPWTRFTQGVELGDEVRLGERSPLWLQCREWIGRVERGQESAGKQMSRWDMLGAGCWRWEEENGRNSRSDHEPGLGDTEIFQEDSVWNSVNGLGWR